MTENATNEDPRGARRWLGAAPANDLPIANGPIRRLRRASAGREAPRREPIEADGERRRTSLALGNLRGLTIVFLVTMHADLAYLVSAPPRPAPFDQAPYPWVAFPVVDASRWLGLDLFCAWQDVYLMCLMFFLSGLFTFSSMERDGALRFLRRRLIRLGAPLVFGVTALMPVALYPVYLQTAPEPRLGDYFAKYFALPFEPAGPLWFLGALLALTCAVALLWRIVRPLIVLGGRLSVEFETRPWRAFLTWALITVAAYAPLALAFTPWRWQNWGPFAIQLSRAALFAVYYSAGLGIGAAGLGAGLLRAGGRLARGWRKWMAAASGSLLLWMGLTGLVLRFGEASPFLLVLASDSSYALACACNVLFLLALCLRFGAVRLWSPLARLSDDAFGVYVLHYAPLVWLQYTLLGVNLPAPLKALIVLFGAGGACLAILAAGRWLFGAVGTRRPLPTI